MHECRSGAQRAAVRADHNEGNHGEDVKEYYFYVDNLPTHSFQRWLDKYPQRPLPYGDLVGTNRARSRLEMEYELIDTGVFRDAPGARRDAVVEAVVLLRPRRMVARAQLDPLRHPSRASRNDAWFRMLNHDVISMPDKWEYPGTPRRTSTFHCVPLATGDPDFAESQLDLMLSQEYLHRAA